MYCKHLPWLSSVARRVLAQPVWRPSATGRCTARSRRRCGRAWATPWATSRCVLPRAPPPEDRASSRRLATSRSREVGLGLGLGPEPRGGLRPHDLMGRAAVGSRGRGGGRGCLHAREDRHRTAKPGLSKDDVLTSRARRLSGWSCIL